MKIYISTLLTLLMCIPLLAQETNDGVYHSTEITEFNLEIDEEIKNYRLKVMEQRRYPLSIKEKNGKLKRDYQPALVSKLIAIDINEDNLWDQYFMINYKKDLVDDFKIIPTQDGFAISQDGKLIKEFTKDGIYFMDNDSQDYFIISEFRDIS